MQAWGQRLENGWTKTVSTLPPYRSQEVYTRGCEVKGNRPCLDRGDKEGKSTLWMVCLPHPSHSQLPHSFLEELKGAGGDSGHPEVPQEEGCCLPWGQHSTAHPCLFESLKMSGWPRVLTDLGETAIWKNEDQNKKLVGTEYTRRGTKGPLHSISFPQK